MSTEAIKLLKVKQTKLPKVGHLNLPLTRGDVVRARLLAGDGVEHDARAGGVAEGLRDPALGRNAVSVRNAGRTLREGPRGGLERASTERGPEAERCNGKSVDR